MQLSTGCLLDADEISALMLQLSGPFHVASDRVGAEPFQASISAGAVRRYLQAPNFSYLVARCPAGTLAGFIALRDQTHLFHLFVAEPFQMKGLGRKLWEEAMVRLGGPYRPSGFTVNASLNAIPFYERVGFKRQGSAKVADGVKFQPMRLEGVEWVQAEAAQAEALAEIRVDAMRESLERVGRFDPQRARTRFLSTFSPECTTVIQVSGRPVGFYVVRRRDADLYVEHLYLVRPSQGQGLGSAALARLIAAADSEGLDIRLGALMHSDANRFYQRHGFALEHAGEFDNYYVRRSGSRGNGLELGVGGPPCA